MIVSKQTYVNQNYWSKSTDNSISNLNGKKYIEDKVDKNDPTFTKHKRYYNDNSTPNLNINNNNNNNKKQKIDK